MRRLLAILCCLVLLSGCGSSPVLTCEQAKLSLDNGQFQYYFSYQYGIALETYREIDPEKPLEEQPFDDSQSWMDFLTDQSYTLAEQTLTLCIAAREAGFSLEETQRAEDQIAALGFTDPVSYLHTYYGKKATVKGYQAFLDEMALAAAYSQELHTQLIYDEKTLSDFYDSHAEDYTDTLGIPKDDTLLPVNVRLIRFYPDDPGSDAHWADARRRAKKVKDAWNGTDEGFALLADENTEDYHAPAGGLYPTVIPGQMEDKLDAWLFAEGRRAGDLTQLDLEDSVVLAYLSSIDTRPYWMHTAENDLRYADYIEALNALEETYSFRRDPEALHLEIPQIPPESREAQG